MAQTAYTVPIDGDGATITAGTSSRVWTLADGTVVREVISGGGGGGGSKAAIANMSGG
jgi:hypothetical protein